MSLRSAAFFRVEGALSPRTAAFTAAWLAAGSQRLGHRLGALGAVALSRPLGFARGDTTLASRVAWMGLRGTSEDRLVVLGEEFHETWVRDALRPVGRELLDRARADGHRVVLVSDNLDVVVRHLAAQLGVDDRVCNRLELHRGRATGRLVDPVIGRFPGLKTFAGREHIDLDRSCGYGSTADDSTLLAAVGLPCAVHPDRGLRRIARDLDWPVVEGP